MYGARHVADRRGGPTGIRPTGAPESPRAPRGRVRQTLLRVAVGLAGVLIVGGGATALGVWRLQGNIHAVDLGPALGTDRPSVAVPTQEGEHEPVNVLVLGSDSREGVNGFIGGKADEGRSDTTLVLHLSADRTRALAVSIPRDSMVDMPNCTDREGRTSPPGTRQFNDAYTIGGAACTQRTVEQLTGVRIDHYVVVDFAGFKGMVDALGGVPICLPKPVNDLRHHIKLPAGRSHVDGDQALAFVRERYALGDGSDLGRIERQHAFLASVLQEATSAGTLTNPSKLYAFLSAATRSVTMDPDLARLQTIAGFAKQVTDVGLDKIQFVTVPVEEYPPDHNRLQWAPGASRLWRAVRQDLPIGFVAPGTTGRTPPRTSPRPASPASPSLSPDEGAGGGQVVVKGIESRTASADICE
jgi:LCP family protein required for cell wall assembly